MPSPEQIRQRREQIERERKTEIERHLTRQVSIELVEKHLAQIRDRYARRADHDSALMVQEVDTFLEAAQTGGDLWEFNTTEGPRGGFVSSEEGYALIRNGEAIAWFITAINA